MVFHCCVKNCDSNSFSHTNLHSRMHIFPKEEHLFLQWLTAVGRDDVKQKIENGADIQKTRRGLRICDLHFTDDCKFVADAKNRTNLKRGSKPTLRLPVNLSEISKNPTSKLNTNASTTIDVENINLNRTLPSLEKITQGSQTTFENTSYIYLEINQNGIDSDLTLPPLQLIEGKSDSITNQGIKDSKFEVDDFIEYITKPDTMKLEVKCRSCLQSNSQLETINSLQTLPGFKELFKYLKLETVPENEFLTNSLCDTCVLQLYNILNFKRQCEKSFEILKENLSVISCNNEIDKNDVTIVNNDCIPSVENTTVTKTLCSFCNKDFRTEKWLKSHKVLVHGIESSLSQCRPCKLINKIDLKFHTSEGHDNLCWLCNKKFATIFHLAKHRLQHLINQENTCLMECKKCHTFFRSQIAFTKHNRKVHKILPEKVTCNLCKKSVYHLKEHLKRHVNHKFKCRDCKLLFDSKNMLFKHKLSHKATDVLCTYCGRMLCRGWINKHIRTVHFGEKKFICQHCGRKFATSTMKIQHEKRVHLLLKEYQCEICLKLFSKKSMLIAHNRIHTLEKPFSCPVCLKTFRWDSVLRRHIKILHGSRLK